MGASMFKLLMWSLVWALVWVLGLHIGKEIESHSMLMIFGVFVAGVANFLAGLAVNIENE